MPILGIMASQMSGKLWAPDGAYDSLATVTVPSGGLASITFAGIPNTYKHLQIRMMCRLSGGSGSQSFTGVMRFNSDTGSNYANHYLYGTGSAAAAGVPGGSNPWNRIYYTMGSAQMSGNIVDILDYANTIKNKTTRILTGTDTNGGGYIALESGLWINTSAITSISIAPESGAFAEYSQFSLYGVR
jgi:hypothetical protein